MDAGRELTPEEQGREWARCEASPIYFIREYCWILNVNEKAWVKFDLWPAQAWSLAQMHRHRQIVALKARQLGFTWLTLCYALWLMLFRATAAVGIYSRIENDSQELLDVRIKGIYERLPGFLQARAVVADNKSRWELSNGSVAMAFATTGGRQYTFSLVMVDEADHQPDLNKLMLAAKPTVDAGGRMVLLSSVDKSAPESQFKQIYRAAKLGENSWHPIFLPWHARPERTPEWYVIQQRDALAATGSLDDVQQEYPATDTEALAPRSLDKRIPGMWIEQCYAERTPGDLPDGAPALDQLAVYVPPQPDRLYVIGADPAEGNPNSDDSAFAVLDVESGEEVAMLAGKYEPSTFATHIDAVGRWYNGAAVMPERNNHGHAVILWLREHSRLVVLAGHDNKLGWNSNALGKSIMYNDLADAFRNEDVTLHSFATYQQIASIEGSTLRAPDGQMDDRADAFALANVGRATARSRVNRTARSRQG